MARDSVNKEQWVIVRKLWESDPVITYQEIAIELGVTRQCVRQKAVRDGWLKNLNLADVERKAHAAADSKFTESAVQEGGSAVDVYGSSKIDPSRKAIDRSLPVVPAGSTPEQAGEIAEKAAVDKRTELIDLHRQELKAARREIYAAIKAAGTKDGYNKARTAKTLTEAFKILHEAERRAWGMEVGDGSKSGQPAPTAIIVKMVQGVKIGN